MRKFSNLEKTGKKLLKRLKIKDEQAFIYIYCNEPWIEFGVFCDKSYFGSSPSSFSCPKMYKLAKRLVTEFRKKLDRKQIIYLPKEYFRIHPWGFKSTVFDSYNIVFY